MEQDGTGCNKTKSISYKMPSRERHEDRGHISSVKTVQRGRVNPVKTIPLKQSHSFNGTYRK